MTTFIAIFHGPTVEEAKLVSVSDDPSLAAAFATCLLTIDEKQGDETAPISDPVEDALMQGRRRALHLIATRSGASH